MPKAKAAMKAARKTTSDSNAWIVAPSLDAKAEAAKVEAAAFASRKMAAIQVFESAKYYWRKAEEGAIEKAAEKAATAGRQRQRWRLHRLTKPEPGGDGEVAQVGQPLLLL